MKVRGTWGGEGYRPGGHGRSSAYQRRWRGSLMGRPAACRDGIFQNGCTHCALAVGVVPPLAWLTQQGESYIKACSTDGGRACTPSADPRGDGAPSRQAAKGWPPPRLITNSPAVGGRVVRW